jgi:hypothetical protein
VRAGEPLSFASGIEEKYPTGLSIYDETWVTVSVRSGITTDEYLFTECAAVVRTAPKDDANVAREIRHCRSRVEGGKYGTPVTYREGWDAVVR